MTVQDRLLQMIPSPVLLTMTIFIAVLVVGSSASVCIADDIDHSSHMLQSTNNSAMFPEERLLPAQVPVVTNLGEIDDFRDGVIADRPVLITFIYTRCTTVCPMANAVMQSVQAKLSKQGMGDARLISISIDPVRDGFKEIVDEAERFSADKQWIFVTGQVPHISELLRSFGLQLGAVEEHDLMFLVGRGEHFTRVSGLANPKILTGLLLRYMEK